MVLRRVPGEVGTCNVRERYFAGRYSSIQREIVACDDFLAVDKELLAVGFGQEHLGEREGAKRKERRGCEVRREESVYRLEGSSRGEERVNFMYHITYHEQNFLSRVGRAESNT